MQMLYYTQVSIKKNRIVLGDCHDWWVPFLHQKGVIGMKLRVPEYYKEFACIADRCKDSCCIGWEIDIDEDTYEYYNQQEGAFGERLRAHMKAGNETSFVLNNGRCPFLNDKNLCDICIELGEASLCEICTEYPRFTLEYGSVREKCLGLSCEEAGRLIFESKSPVKIVETIQPYDYEEEEEDALADALEKARDHSICIMQNRDYGISDRIRLLLLFADEVQREINENELEKIDTLIMSYQGQSIHRKLEQLQGITSTESHKQLFEKRMKRFLALEVLDKEWLNTVKQIRKRFSTKTDEEYEQLTKEFLMYYESREYEYEHLVVYFIFRYGMKSVYDSDFLGKIKFAVASFLMIRDMDVERFLDNEKQYSLADRIDVARIYSKEVEHSEENLEMLAEDFVFEAIFTVNQLIYTII